MRNPERINPTIELLKEFWAEHPDYRLGQLMMVIAKTGEHNPKLFYMEDEEFIKLLKQRKDELNNL